MARYAHLLSPFGKRTAAVFRRHEEWRVYRRPSASRAEGDDVATNPGITEKQDYDLILMADSFIYVIPPFTSLIKKAPPRKKRPPTTPPLQKKPRKCTKRRNCIFPSPDKMAAFLFHLLPIFFSFYLQTKSLSLLLFLLLFNYCS